MAHQKTTRLSKFLSYILRHNPTHIDIELTDDGWIDIQTLILKAQEKSPLPFDEKDLLYVVETNEKQRFAINEQKTMIRANQGHTININLKLKETPPPDILYHGTTQKFFESISEKGLLPMSRHDVHLSDNIQSALSIGSRHGKPIILQIDSKKMNQHGFSFFKTENNVWLTKNVPPEFITKIEHKHKKQLK